ncbi:hypothetical protein SSTG_05923 [Streptomyces sp. e14]|nr:hypothetical protein SSTG_05923 [Streptomyces sp. e14]
MGWRRRGLRAAEEVTRRSCGRPGLGLTLSDDLCSSRHPTALRRAGRRAVRGMPAGGGVRPGRVQGAVARSGRQGLSDRPIAGRVALIQGLALPPDESPLGRRGASRAAERRTDKASARQVFRTDSLPG